jgi:hypothetical protein
MKLFNKTIDRQLFKQYALGSDLSKQEVVVKIFNPQGGGNWFILNSDPEDPDYLWAIVDLGYGAEVGSVSRSDLETYRGKFGLGFERDLSFDPINAEELYKGLRQGKYYDKGGEVSFIDYNESEIMYEPHNKKYYANDVEFDSLQEAKDFIDRGEINADIRDAYSKGMFADGGEIASKLQVLFERMKKSLSTKNFNSFNNLSNKVHEISDAKGLTEKEYEVWDSLREKENELRMTAFLGKSKYAKGGNIENFSDNQQMIMNQNVELEHHHEELEDILEDEMPVPAWVVAKMATATQSISDVTHYLDGEKELMEDEDEEDYEDEDKDYGEIENREVVEPINVSAGTKAEMTKKFTDDAMGNLKGFLKGMEGIDLRDDYTFDYKNEQFEVEPIINSDESGVSNAVFTIFDGDGEEVGEVAYSREGGKQKFTANSEFFEWDRAKFEDGGFMNNVYAEGGGIKKSNPFIEIVKVMKDADLSMNDDDERKILDLAINMALVNGGKYMCPFNSSMFNLTTKQIDYIDSLIGKYRTKHHEEPKFSMKVNGKYFPIELRVYSKFVQGSNRYEDKKYLVLYSNLDPMYEYGGFMNGVYAEGGLTNNDMKKLWYVTDKDDKIKNISTSIEQAEVFLSKIGYVGNINYVKVPLNDWNSEKVTVSNIKNYAEKFWKTYSQGGYFDGTIPKVSTYMTNYAEGGEIAKAEVFGLKRNIMGTTDIEMKISGMRKAQDFIVYPIGKDDAGSIITIQSETRIGKIDLTSGRGLMSQSHSNGAYFIHFQMDKLIPFTVSDSDLQNIKSHIFKTAGANVGTRGVVSDNSGASGIYAEGGFMNDVYAKGGILDAETIKIGDWLQKKDNKAKGKVFDIKKDRFSTDIFVQDLYENKVSRPIDLEDWKKITEPTRQLARIEKMKQEFAEEVSYAKGGVTYFNDENQHRLSRPSGSFEKEIFDKVRDMIDADSFVGSFGWRISSGKKAYMADGFLYKLDAYDQNLIKNLRLKQGEKVFRYVNRTTAIGGMMPFIKINIEKALLYFPLTNENDEILFETKGVTPLWINLIEGSFAEGGSVAKDVVIQKSGQGEFTVWHIIDSKSPFSYSTEVSFDSKEEATKFANKKGFNIVTEFENEYAQGGKIKLGDIVEVKEPNYGFDSEYYVVNNKAGYDQDGFLISETRKRVGDVFEEDQLNKIYAKGGMVVTSIKDIPDFEEKLNQRKITYRGLGMGKLFDDFYKLAGTSGTRIKVDGKEYFITDEEFNTFSRDSNGKMIVRFEAPERKDDGGSFDKPFDVAYKTKSGKGMVALRIMAKNEEEAKQKLIKQMRSSDSFDKVYLAYPSFEDGGFTNEVYAKGGGVKAKFISTPIKEGDVFYDKPNAKAGYYNYRVINKIDGDTVEIEVADTFNSKVSKMGNPYSVSKKYVQNIVDEDDKEKFIIEQEKEKTKNEIIQQLKLEKYKGGDLNSYIVQKDLYEELSKFQKYCNIKFSEQDKKIGGTYYGSTQMFSSQRGKAITLSFNDIHRGGYYGGSTPYIVQIQVGGSLDSNLKQSLLRVGDYILKKYFFNNEYGNSNVRETSGTNWSSVMLTSPEKDSRFFTIPYFNNLPSYKDGGFMNDVYAEGGDVDNVGTTQIKKDPRGNWRAENNIADFNGYDWRLSTLKTYSGQLISAVQGGKSEKGNGYTTFKYTMYEDPYHTLEVSKPTRFSEKVVTEQHEKALAKFKKYMETGMFRGGGQISNFDKLSDKVAKEYEGKPVKSKYQEEYGKYYSKEEAQEVGDKVAGKVKAMQTDSKAFGGLFSSAKQMVTPKKYPELEGKQVLLKSGKIVQVLTQSGGTLYVIELGKLGTGIKPNAIDISEVDLTKL